MTPTHHTTAVQHPWRALKLRPSTRRMTNLAIIFLVLVATAFSIQPAAALDRAGVERALRATVQVIVPDNEFEMFSLGSGTVMNDQGLILTNFHVVEGDRSNGLMNDEGLAGIAVTPPDLRGEAILKYFGIVVKTDPVLDLALIQIVALADDPEAPLPANLGLTPIEYGDSEELMISDEINMFGFPGLGGNTATYTKGIVSGFLDENRDGIYEWIKTDAELSHGNSGGLATDGMGRFVGVPTAGNTDDVGKIGLVRTGNLAIGFVNSYFPSPVGNGAQVTRVQFAEAVNRRGQPISPGVQFGAGITDLYAVFDYVGLEDGRAMTFVWYLDGFEILRDSFAWDGGESGSSWSSIYNDNGLDEGFTELEIVYDGTPLYRGGVMVGEGSAPTPVDTNAAISEFTFAEDVANDQPVNTGTTFSGVDVIYAFFDFSGMSNGLTWTTTWYLDGQLILEDDYIWDAGEAGTNYVSLSHPDGLPEGTYTLEISIEGELAQSGSVTVQAGNVPPQPSEIGVIGVVVDRNNSRQTISGALIVFLTPGVTVQDWIDTDFADNMIHAMGTSNRRGEFQLDNTVVPGESYSIVAVHDDYEPVAADDFQIPPNATDPFELEVTMDRS